MNGVKMRQIILKFLLICNIVLFAVSVFFYAGHRIRLNNYSRDAVTLMEKNGVGIETGIYQKLTSKRNAYTLRTDSDMRDRFCTSLAGENSKPQAQSGGVILWTGSMGTVTWNTTGTLSGNSDFSAYGDMTDEQAAVKCIERLLKGSGTDMKQTKLVSLSDESGVVVTVKQSFDNTETADCKLTFTFDNTGNMIIDGRWFFGTPEPVVMDELNNSSPIDILLAVPKTDSGITQITAAEPVYYVSSKSGGRFTLIPCWKLITDKGDVVIDPTTGAQAGSDTMSPDTNTDNAYPAAPSEGAPADGSYTTDGTAVPNDGTVQDGTAITDGSTPTDTNPSVGDDSSWDSSTGTDKIDPELPDENGVYG